MDLVRRVENNTTSCELILPYLRRIVVRGEGNIDRSEVQFQNPNQPVECVRADCLTLGQRQSRLEDLAHRRPLG